MVCVALAVIAAIPRFHWMLNGNYNAVIIIFIHFAVFPFILLTREGRRQIGFARINLTSALVCFVAGACVSLVIYYIGKVLYGHTDHHWYVVVKNSFDKGDMVQQVRQSVPLFFAVTIPTMIFSPIGEEFFFRGLLHESIRTPGKEALATLVDASFFGITHLAHYGLVISAGSVNILPGAFVWVVLMGITSVIFYRARVLSGSIWGAVICHAGFNFAMMYSIFYLIG